MPVMLQELAYGFIIMTEAGLRITGRRVYIHQDCPRHSHNLRRSQRESDAILGKNDQGIPASWLMFRSETVHSGPWRPEVEVSE